MQASRHPGSNCLPAGASAENVSRFAIAQELAAACPAALGKEIAVTGSVAMGLADETSDVELNLWVENLPAVEERAAWIVQIGGTEAQISPREWSDGTLNATFCFRDAWVEAGWMTTAHVEETLHGILAAEVLDHTYGPNASETDHLNATLFVDHVRRMREEGPLADGARVFAHHIAHATNPPHPELSAYAAQHGYGVPYDGLTVEC